MYGYLQPRGFFSFGKFPYVYRQMLQLQKRSLLGECLSSLLVFFKDSPKVFLSIMQNPYFQNPMHYLQLNFLYHSSQATPMTSEGHREDRKRRGWLKHYIVHKLNFLKFIHNPSGTKKSVKKYSICLPIHCSPCA